MKIELGWDLLESEDDGGKEVNRIFEADYIINEFDGDVIVGDGERQDFRCRVTEDSAAGNYCAEVWEIQTEPGESLGNRIDLEKSGKTFRDEDAAKQFCVSLLEAKIERERKDAND